jgi:hypothetical protein
MLIFNSLHFVVSSLTCSQNWLRPLVVNVHQPTYLTKKLREGHYWRALHAKHEANSIMNLNNIGGFLHLLLNSGKDLTAALLRDGLKNPGLF